jgi:carbohydrate-binding DOMON domain-containing protein
MKDNYGDVGKTYTAPWGLLDQERNPLIGASARTATPTTSMTKVPSTVKTTVATTIQTTVQTTVTTPSPEPTTLQTTVQTAAPTALPTAAPTKSPGFEAVLAGAGLLIALAWSVRKE